MGVVRIFDYHLPLEGGGNIFVGSCLSALQLKLLRKHMSRKTCSIKVGKTLSMYVRVFQG